MVGPVPNGGTPYQMVGPVPNGGTFTKWESVVNSCTKLDTTEMAVAIVVKSFHLKQLVNWHFISCNKRVPVQYRDMRTERQQKLL